MAHRSNGGRPNPEPPGATMSLRASVLSIGLLLLGACADPPASTRQETGPVAVPDLREPRLAALGEAVERAQGLCIGEVVSIDQRLSEPDADGTVLPFRFVTFRVLEAGFGMQTGQLWTGRFAGGPLPDGRDLWVSEVPDFQVGDRALMAVGNGDEGACALSGCDEGYLPLSATGGMDEARALLETLDDGRPTLARSADKDAAFTVSFAPPPSEADYRAAAARARARLERPLHADDSDPAERAALEANGFNPVLAR